MQGVSEGGRLGAAVCGHSGPEGRATAVPPTLRRAPSSEILVDFNGLVEYGFGKGQILHASEVTPPAFQALRAAFLIPPGLARMVHVAF